MSWTFSEEAPKWSANFLNCFRAIWHVCSLWHTQGYLHLLLGLISLVIHDYVIVVGYLTVQPLFWRRFSQDIDPKVLPGSRGFPKFLEGLLRDCEATSREIASWLLLLSSRYEESLVRFLHFSPMGFLRAVVSSCSERRRGKYRGNRSIFSGVLRVIYYQLTLSRSDFAKCRTRLVWLFLK